eukprot:SM000019S05113  [mRNA]  locus=s19:1146362:1151999:+ [translate_table: standard]
MQYHGTSDQWQVDAAASPATRRVASLSATATASTGLVAVSLRAVGVTGGQVAAFTFDIARSVVYTRQGNPAWAGQERDMISPKRSDDLFYGVVGQEWVNRDKVHIPQADELMRLLSNVIRALTLDIKPLPKLWYFPNYYKVVIILTGDEHGDGNVASRFDNLMAADPPSCNLTRWECIRGSSYFYLGGSFSNTQAQHYQSLGFEMGVHVNTGCADWTPATLDQFYVDQLGSFGEKYTSVPPQTTHRTHCIAWSDWATQPKVELSHGIRLDTNYYYYPPFNTQGQPGWISGTYVGHMSGSALPMRFADLDGTIIDVFQVMTEMTDESGQTYPSFVNTLLDAALGSPQYYAALTVNAHSDSEPNPVTQAIVASSKSRSTPVVSATQMLQWIDNRNKVSFSNIVMSPARDSLTFTVATSGSFPWGVTSTLPTAINSGVLLGITGPNGVVSYKSDTIKGIQHAVFAVMPGDYTAAYSNAPLPPSPPPPPPVPSAPTPAPSIPPSTPAPMVYDSTAADFAAATSLSAACYVSQESDGEVILAPTLAMEFPSPLGPNFEAAIWDGTGSLTNAATGKLTLSRAYVRAAAYTAAPTADQVVALEFSANFSADATASQNQHVGFGTDLNNCPWALISTTRGSSSQLYARTCGPSNTDEVIGLGDSSLGTFHTFRLEWRATGFTYLLDGVIVATSTITIGSQLRPIGSAYSSNPTTLTLDWLHLSPYSSAACQFTSQPLAAPGAAAVMWQSLTLDEDVPASTSVGSVAWSYGSVLPPDASWKTVALPVQASPTWALSPATASKYMTYSFALASTDGQHTPTVRQAAATYGTASSPAPPQPVSPLPPPTLPPPSPKTSPPILPPPPPTPVAPTQPPMTILTDTSTADFAAGSGAGCYVAQRSDGEVIVAPTLATEFSTPVGSDFEANTWDSQGALTYDTTAGTLTLSRAYVRAAAFTIAPIGSQVIAVEFSAKYAADAAASQYQHVGFGTDLNACPWAIISTTRGTSGQLYARTCDGTNLEEVIGLSDSSLGAFHTFRIEWRATGFTYLLDNVVVATSSVTIGAQMRPIGSVLSSNQPIQLTLDWLHLLPYGPTSPSCTFTSRALAAPGSTPALWTSLSLEEDVPAGTSVTSVSWSYGDVLPPDASWTTTALPANGGPVYTLAASRSTKYMAYSFVLSSSADGQRTAAIGRVAVSYQP